MDLKAAAAKLNTDIAALSLALRDKDTPLPAKIFAGLTVAYALSPIDLIPDFIPVLGYLDDAILLPLLVALTVRFIPKDVLERQRAATRQMQQGRFASKWYYAIPVVLFWLIVLGLILKAVLL